MLRADYHVIDISQKGVTAPLRSAVSPQGILDKAYSIRCANPILFSYGAD
jgi:hypothetical protein